MHDLTAFTACEGGRYPAAEKVVEWGGWRWATDFRMAVREPAGEGCGTEARPKDFPNTLPVFEGVPWERCVDEMPRFVGAPIYDECEACETDECAHCGGHGTVECSECGAEHLCGLCGGDGFIKRSEGCAKCGGQGEVAVPGDQRIGGELFQGRLLLRVREAFPQARVAVMPLRDRSNGEQGLYFTAPGGVQGVVVFMRERAKGATGRFTLARTYLTATAAGLRSW